ncbi:MAG: tetratricopeptide repeat protein [Candidatus Eisenbacteria bacterium]|nr:tetratricopeptide repeat protein [Candidatus Eisenbacteria bacterium]
MRQLIPPFIHDRAGGRRDTGRFRATVLSLDIVGFTSMTQRLMILGRAGAEAVTGIINEVFDPAAREIDRHGGWIGKFVGDQVVAFFQTDSHLVACHAAEALQGFFRGLPPFATPVGAVRLHARIGIAQGMVSWGILRGPTRDVFYFRGRALSRCMRAQARCEPGGISIDSPPAAAASRFETSGTEPRPPSLDSALVSRFVPTSVLELEEAGEFREIACVFLAFRPEKRRLSHAFLRRFVPVIVDAVGAHDGFLSELDFGDKGSLALVYLGAPVGMERPAAHAASLALQIRAKTAGWATIRAGISQGRVFAGFVGSDLRCEYKAVGSVVNLAARLMSAAPWDRVYLDQNAVRRVDRFRTAPVTPVALKGYADPIPAFELLARSEDSSTRGVAAPLVGRRRELERMRRFLEPLELGRSVGVLYVDGSAGIGKSRLVQELRTEATEGGCMWIPMPCDEILRQSLNPLRYLAREYFGCTSGRTGEQRVAGFDARFRALIERADPDGRAELERCRSILGAAVDLRWEDSPYERLDARGRRELTFRAFKLLLKVEARQRPVILELEDCQWVDADTAEFIRALMQNVDEYPLAVIAVARLHDDGSAFRLSLGNVAQDHVCLDRMDEETTNELLCGLLGGAPSSQFRELLWRRSEGNPFYLGQLARFMMETGAICLRHGHYDVAGDAGELPDTISAVLTARIDRLAGQLRDAVKHASVLGREFNIRLLDAMLNGERTEMLLEAGSREAIWEPLSELVYIFGHALIREAAYQMQLQRTLRKLHRLAAETIEDLYRADLSPHAGALAHHYDRAGDVMRAEPYLWRAAEAAESRWGNQEALACYRRLASYPGDADREIDLGRRQVTLLERIGKLEDAERTARECVDKSRQLHEPGPLIGSLNALGNVLFRRGMPDDAHDCFQEALRHATAHNDLKGISAAANNIGRIHRLHGRFQEAMSFFKKDLRVGLRLGDRKGVAYTLGNMGGVFGSLGDLRRARRCFEQALRVAEEFGDRFGIAISCASIGLVCVLRGEYDQAIRYFARQKEVAEETGDLYNVAYAAGNIGEVLEKTGEPREALRLYEKKLEISLEMGYQQGVGIALSCLGRVWAELGDHRTAIGLHDRAIAIGRELRLDDYLCGYLNLRVQAELLLLPGPGPARVEALEEMARQALQVAARVGKTEEATVAGVLLARLEAARGAVVAATSRLLGLRHAATPRAEARILHALFDITGDEQYRAEAREAYDRVLAECPDCRLRRERSGLDAADPKLETPARLT